MARRRKNRTHNKGNVTAKTSNGITGDPKSFVIKHGAVGYSIAQLVRDVRKVMEPNTATRLRVGNSLLLFKVVSDVFYRSERGTS